MAISLQKGGNVSLRKESPGVRALLLGVGWEIFATPFDIDISCFLLGDSGTVVHESDFVFYNNPKSEDGSITYLGASLHDKASFSVSLPAVSGAIKKITFVATIREAKVRRQTFGLVKNVYARVFNAATSQEIARYNLTEDTSLFTAITLCEIYRRDAEWKFRALGGGFEGGLKPLAQAYGVYIG